MTKNELLAMPASSYMNKDQRIFFASLVGQLVEAIRARIEAKKPELERVESFSDPTDTATLEELRQRVAVEIQRDTQRIKALQETARRIAHDDLFGFCEVSGSEIGLPRMLLLPEARLSVEEQERQERLARHQSQRIT